MEPATSFWTYWYFHLPNYLLAALIHTLLGRFVLEAFVPPDWPNVFWRAFKRITDPLLAATAAITPRMVGPRALIPVAAFWLFALRLALMVGLAWAGLAPTA